MIILKKQIIIQTQIILVNLLVRWFQITILFQISNCKLKQINMNRQFNKIKKGLKRQGKVKIIKRLEQVVIV